MSRADYFTRLLEQNARHRDLYEYTGDTPRPVNAFWYCTRCDCKYKSEYSADNCCMSSSSYLYMCPACFTGHNMIENALTCCDGSGTLTAQCQVCMRMAVDLEEAVDCCLLMHPTMTGEQRQHMRELIRGGSDWLGAMERVLNDN